MSKLDRSINILRKIAKQLSSTGQLTENQALAYVFSVIGRMDQEKAVLEMGVEPSNFDTHLQEAKQTVGTHRELIYLIDIFEGNPANLKEGMKLPAIPPHWEETFLEYEEASVTVQVYELSDNRYAKCKLHPLRQNPIEVEAVGALHVLPPRFDPQEFEDYFDEVFDIDITLTKESYINLATTYQTMVEYCIGRRMEGLRLSGEWKYLKVTHEDLGSSPSWMAVNSVDELVHTTSELALEANQLEELKSEFLDAYQPGKHALTEGSVYSDEDGEKRMQFYEHIGEAFRRATDTDHLLTFDWDIQEQSYNDASQEQANRYYKRECYKHNIGGYLDFEIEAALRVDLSKR